MILTILVKLCTWAIKSLVQERDLELSSWILYLYSITEEKEGKKTRRKELRRGEIHPEVALVPETELWDFMPATGTRRGSWAEASPQAYAQPRCYSLLSASCLQNSWLHAHPVSTAIFHQLSGEMSSLLRSLARLLCFLSFNPQLRITPLSS